VQNAMSVIDRLLAATNAHDVDAITACFAIDYTLDSPLHPARSFKGNAQVRRNWTQILGAIRDLSARIVGSACDGATAWTEWEMSGTRPDGAPHLMRGVFVFRIENDAIVTGRMFLEPVDESPVDANEAVRRATS
jgi:ketosteroid isomerase-like protein